MVMCSMSTLHGSQILHHAKFSVKKETQMTEMKVSKMKKKKQAFMAYKSHVNIIAEVY